jgi:hypothetical protein
MAAACPLSYVLVGVILSAQMMHGPGARMRLPAQPDIAASRHVR